MLPFPILHHKICTFIIELQTTFVSTKSTSVLPGKNIFLEKNEDFPTFHFSKTPCIDERFKENKEIFGLWGTRLVFCQKMTNLKKDKVGLEPSVTAGERWLNAGSFNVWKLYKMPSILSGELHFGLWCGCILYGNQDVFHLSKWHFKRLTNKNVTLTNEKTVFYLNCHKRSVSFFQRP